MFARYFIEYFWVLVASPFMLAYLGVGGLILGFVSIWFGFHYNSFGGYLKSILHDETLAGLGFVQTTVAVPLIALAFPTGRPSRAGLAAVAVGGMLAVLASTLILLYRWITQRRLHDEGRLEI